MAVDRDGFSYYIRLIATLNHISGNPSIWAQPRGHGQFSKCANILCALYFIAYILCLPCTCSATGQSELSAQRPNFHSLKVRIVGKNAHLCLSIGIKTGDSKLLSEICVYSYELCVSLRWI